MNDHAPSIATTLEASQGFKSMACDFTSGRSFPEGPCSQTSLNVRPEFEDIGSPSRRRHMQHVHFDQTSLFGLVPAHHDGP